jgi:hypothetical protein
MDDWTFWNGWTYVLLEEGNQQRYSTASRQDLSTTHCLNRKSGVHKVNLA